LFRSMRSHSGSDRFRADASGMVYRRLEASSAARSPGEMPSRAITTSRW
jgi:hypothetical protein